MLTLLGQQHGPTISIRDGQILIAINQEPARAFFIFCLAQIITIVYTLVIMSNKTVLNVKIDKELKRQAQETAKALGLPISTIVSASLRDIVARRSITISDQPRIRPEVEAELLEMSRQFKAGTLDVSPVFETAEESFVWLDKELATERKKSTK